jgi:NhaP-type Na+/H+ or K+/H+ antiporter
MVVLDPAALLYLAVGLATLAAALLPKALRRAPVSMPMVFLGAGVAVFALVPALPDPDPMLHPELALHLTELCVIVALMGAGLAINRPFDLRTWSTTWRLLGITMLLSMLAVGVLGWWVLGLSTASAMLLAAVLAPTDPVLATEVQVSEPVTDPDAADDEARFALTSEAGLNDGLAYPFTYAAVAASVAGARAEDWLPRWLMVDVGWRLGVGLAAGLLVGWLLGRLFFSTLAERLRFNEKSEGFVAVAATFLAYGVAELAQGYGFVAVFVCACTVRSAEREHGYHTVLHTFVEQVERLLTVGLIVLLGGAIARGLLTGIGFGRGGGGAGVPAGDPSPGRLARADPRQDRSGRTSSHRVLRRTRHRHPVLRRVRGGRGLLRRAPDLGARGTRGGALHRAARDGSHPGDGRAGSPSTTRGAHRGRARHRHHACVIARSRAIRTVSRLHLGVAARHEQPTGHQPSPGGLTVTTLMRRSVWHPDEPPAARQAQEPPQGRYDVVVVGAGIVGLTCALRLARSGARVLVLEAEDVLGGGVTGQSTAKVTVAHGTALSSIRHRTGDERAHEYLAAAQQGLDHVRSSALGRPWAEAADHDLVSGDPAGEPALHAYADDLEASGGTAEIVPTSCPAEARSSP